MAKTINIINPYTGGLIETLPLKTTEELLEIVDTAYKAKAVWGNMPLYERGSLINKFADLVERDAEKIGRISTAEMAKPISQSISESIDGANILRAAAERANHLYGNVLAQNQQNCADDIIFTMREPLGVIGCIIPNNFPIELTFQKVAPALIMGNTVLIKAPSSNPLAILSLQALVKEAGIPDGVVQIFVCDRHAITDAVIKNPRVDAVSMTGSTTAGIEIARNGAETLKRVFLELGGNDALVIFDDADLDLTVAEIIGGRLENNGQVCCSPKRLVVQKGVADQLAEKLIAAIKAAKSGDPMDPETVVSALVTEQAAIEVEEQIKHTLSQGAILAHGGTRSGARIEPTVLINVTKDMDIAQNMEIFGPVMPIITFETEDEAIEIANNSHFGLSSGIMSGDTIKALRVGKQLQAGAAVINGCGNYRHRDQEFGGYKMSGLGREGAGISLEEFSQVKTYAIKGAFKKQ